MQSPPGSLSIGAARPSIPRRLLAPLAVCGLWPGKDACITEPAGAQLATERGMASGRDQAMSTYGYGGGAPMDDGSLLALQGPGFDSAARMHAATTPAEGCTTLPLSPPSRQEPAADRPPARAWRGQRIRPPREMTAPAQDRTGRIGTTRDWRVLGTVVSSHSEQSKRRHRATAIRRRRPRESLGCGR